MRAQRPTRWVPRGTRSCRCQDFRDVASAVKTTKAPASASKSSLSDFVTPADYSLAAAVGTRLWSCQLTIKDLVLSADSPGFGLVSHSPGFGLVSHSPGFGLVSHSPGFGLVSQLSRL